MIRLEMLREVNGEFHTVGIYKMVPDFFFVLINIHKQPAVVNDDHVSFPEYTGHETLVLTHLGIFTDVEYTGIVTDLTTPLKVRNGGVVSFKRKSIVMEMANQNQIGITVIKGES